MTKFETFHWNGYQIRLFHLQENLRSVINWIPYFWDDEVAYTLAIRASRKVKRIDDVWTYKWRLVDLEGNRIKQGKDTVNVTNSKWMRRYLRYWTSGKARAIVLGNLPPNKHYIVKMEFTNGKGEHSGDIKMATLSTKDRTDFYMQMFLIIFSIVAALFFAMFARGCGL